MSSKIVLFAAIAALAVSALAVDSATAAPGGNGVGKGKGGGNGGNGGTTATATLTVSPNPVPAWGYIYTVTGTGFTPNSAVNFSFGGVVTFEVADANGVASAMGQSGAPGPFRVDAYQHNGKSWVMVGSVTFQMV